MPGINAKTMNTHPSIRISRLPLIIANMTAAMNTAVNPIESNPYRKLTPPNFGVSSVLSAGCVLAALF